jgi:hypothetical protein
VVRSLRSRLQGTTGGSGKRTPPDFKFPMIFTHPNFEIQNEDLPDIQNSLNFAERQFEI